MLQLTKDQKEYSLNNILQKAFTPVCSNKEIDKTFAHDLKVILKATKYIKNPTTQQQILEFCLAALIAKYAESKISYLLGVFSPQNPLVKKITPDHISTLLQNADACDKRDRDERRNERNYNFKIMVTVLFTSVLVCGLFIWTAQTDLLKFFIGAIFGFGGGFGVGKFYKKQ